MIKEWIVRVDTKWCLWFIPQFSTACMNMEKDTVCQTNVSDYWSSHVIIK